MPWQPLRGEICLWRPQSQPHTNNMSAARGDGAKLPLQDAGPNLLPEVCGCLLGAWGTGASPALGLPALLLIPVSVSGRPREAWVGSSSDGIHLEKERARGPVLAGCQPAEESLKRGPV